MLALKVEGEAAWECRSYQELKEGFSQTPQCKPHSQCINSHGGQKLSLTLPCILITRCVCVGGHLLGETRCWGLEYKQRGRKLEL